MKNSTTHSLLFALFIILVVTGITGCRKSGHCEGPVCQHGGYCSGDTCACPLGYSGDLCENFNPCDTIHCLNGGACVNGVCLCSNGFYGARCDSPIRDLYLGNYSGTLTISSQGAAATATVAADPSSSTGIIITVEQFIAMKGTLSADGSFNIPSQSQTVGTVSGSGSFSGNTLNVSFGENLQVTTINCSFVGTKQ